MMLEGPTLLVLLGTLLMSVAIFAPQPRPLAARATVAFAVPAAAAFPQREPVPPAPPSWPLLVEPDARAPSPAVRRAMVEALAALGEPWCDEILRRAADEEKDEQVRAALARALRP